MNNLSKLPERLKELMSDHDLTGFSYDNFNKWLKGITSPYIDNLIRLAEAFDCSVDYLLGRIE